MNVEMSSGVDPRLKTKATELFGVDYPVVQTGMGWVAGPSLVTGTANAGGLGILAAATMTLEEMKTAIAEVKSRTEQPFGVNLRTDAADVEQRVDHLISENVKVASFAQAPRPDMVKKLKDNGLVVMPTVGARRHAEKVAEVGSGRSPVSGKRRRWSHRDGAHFVATPTGIGRGRHSGGRCWRIPRWPWFGCGVGMGR